MTTSHRRQPPSLTTTEPDGPRTSRARWLARTALAWALLYGGVRTYWQFGHLPGGLSPLGTDLVIFTGWRSVALCAAAALVATLLGTVRAKGSRRMALVTSGWAVSAALLLSSALLLLDVVSGVLPGLGPAFYPLGALSRAACAGGGALLGAATLAYQRRTGGCPSCGRSGARAGLLERIPGWAFWAAYVAVAGALTRVLAQAWVGFTESPFSAGASMLLFEVGFVLGGTLLPLSLVYSWGRIWPGWVPGLAGRRVPRWLVLGPAAGISGGLVAYFGVTLLHMVGERLSGRNPFPPSGGLDLPEGFFWVAVPAYLVWGLGMAAAALAYHHRTRRPCPSCSG